MTPTLHQTGAIEAAVAPETPPSLLAVAATGCCPRCGRGHLFAGLVTPAPRCEVCGLDIRAIECGDGPAVFVILAVGFLVTVAALVTEVRFAPPYWLHAMLWLPLTVGLSLGLLRPAKAVMTALEWRRRRAAAPRSGAGDGQ